MNPLHESGFVSDQRCLVGHLPFVSEPGKIMTVAKPVAAQNDTQVAASKADKVADKVYWLEVKRYPYQPDHQVELLHLQAEADALLIKLQAKQAQPAQAPTEHT